MKARQLRPYVTIITLMAFAMACGKTAPSSQTLVGNASTLKRTNIVYILADDLDDMITTDTFLRQVMPFTLSLRDASTRFLNARSSTICCNARAGILTGLNPHNSGVLTNAGSYGGYGAFKNPIDSNGNRMKDASGNPIDNENRTFAKYLSDAGYRTAIFGKYLNDYEADSSGNLPNPIIGWTDGHVAIDHSFYTGYQYRILDWSLENPTATATQYGTTEADYSTDVISKKATDFIKTTSAQSPGKPFMMYVAPTAPHLPLAAAKRHQVKAKRWGGTLPTNRANFYQDGSTISDKPGWLKDTWLKRDNTINHVWTNKDWENRLGSLYALDEAVQAIYETLKSTGTLDDTLIVFTSDNGYNLGAHRLNNKMAPYEESTRVPAFAWAGKNLALAGGKNITELTQHIDFAPTFLELAGLAIPSHIDGQSLVPFLKGTTVPWKKDVIEEYYGGLAADGITTELPQNISDYIFIQALPALALDVPTHKSVRSQIPVLENGVKKVKNYAYIEWYDNTTKAVTDTELYDLDVDPFELDNLVFFKKQECNTVIEAFKSRLSSLKDCSGASCSALPSYAADSALLNVTTCKK